MWKSLVVHVLLPVIDLRQAVSIIFVMAVREKKSTYPFELEVKLKDSLKGKDYVS